MLLRGRGSMTCAGMQPARGMGLREQRQQGAKRYQFVLAGPVHVNKCDVCCGQRKGGLNPEDRTTVLVVGSAQATNPCIEAAMASTIHQAVSA
jgi:hypothetical protein